MSKDIQTLKSIISDAGLCTRPEYTSGRGATLSDLNSKHLLAIQKGIKSDFGEDASKAFVDMVAGIQVLSCTTFLNELYALFYREWKPKEIAGDAPGIEIQKNEDGNYDMLHGVISMVSAMGNNRDDTEAIRGEFLRSNGMKSKDMSRHGYIFKYSD